MSLRVSVSLVLLFAVAVISAGHCPRSRYISPCTCSSPPDGQSMLIECSDIQDFGTIRPNLAEGLKNKIPITLILTNLGHLSHLPRDFIYGLKVNTLTIVKTPIKTIHPDAFRGNEGHLRHLTIHDSSFPQPLVSPAFKNLTSLVSLHIVANSKQAPLIKLTKADTENVPDRIYSITFSVCGIKDIEPGTFSRFRNLGALYLYFNNITTFTENNIPKSLKHLKLNYCRFTKIPVKTLLSAKGKPIVDLSNTMIRSLPAESSMRKLLDKGIGFIFNYTPLDCECKDKWIVDYIKAHGRVKMEAVCLAAGPRQYIRVNDLKSENFDDCN